MKTSLLHYSTWTPTSFATLALRKPKYSKCHLNFQKDSFFQVSAIAKNICVFV